jgi:hypothetical protein
LSVVIAAARRPDDDVRPEPFGVGSLLADDD